VAVRIFWQGNLRQLSSFSIVNRHQIGALRRRGHNFCPIDASGDDGCRHPLAMADGMGVGKPAIVSAATGIRDLIEHGVNGHVVPAGDVDRLAQSLQCFAADRKRLREMGEAAYDTTRSCGWDRFRRRIGDLVESTFAASAEGRCRRA
jgi:hypothetical protein